MIDAGRANSRVNNTNHLRSEDQEPARINDEQIKRYLPLLSSEVIRKDMLKPENDRIYAVS